MDLPNMILGILFWMALSVVLFFVWENRKTNKASSKADILLNDAHARAGKISQEAKREAQSLVDRAKNESLDITKKVEKIEERILEREEKISDRLDNITKKQDELREREEKMRAIREKLQEKSLELDGKISEIAGLSEKEARKEFLKQISDKYQNDGVSVIEKYKRATEERKKEISRDIILKSIQQYAGDVTQEVTTTIITLPSDDLKGKLIGKEGRNITAFERATGVALIIDDTPDSVFISAFDLYRRYVAKKSLEKLIEDGRIQPARIEEIVANTNDEAEVLLRELGQKTLEELNITGIPDEMVPVIGKLRFRTSYGQNILKHSKEVAYIAESLARDLGADPELCKKGGLLHDVGKALDQDIEGTHPDLGAKLGRKYGLDEKVVDMIENHHGDQFTISLEAAIVQMADAISSVRPGARREAIEQYIQRVKEMEALVQSFPGVNKAYAISAGREVRVFVDADNVNDFKAQEMARDIAHEIQNKLSYPGEVKVNLIREMRVIEYAK